MSKKEIYNPTSGRGNYSSVKNEVRIAIWYLTKEKEIKQIMTQGTEDLVALTNDDKKHLIQIKETTKAKKRFSDKDVVDALSKLNSEDNTEIEVLAIASNVSIVIADSTRTLIEEKFTHKNNKSMPGFDKYKKFLETRIDIEKFHLLDAPFKQLRKITLQQIRDLLKIWSSDNMVAVDEESILDGLIFSLQDKGAILVDEKKAENIEEQWIKKTDIMEASKLFISSKEVKQMIKDLNYDLSPFEEKEFTTKISSYIREYNAMPAIKKAIKEEFLKIGHLKNSEMTIENVEKVFDVLWEPTAKKEMKEITIKIFLSIGVI